MPDRFDCSINRSSLYLSHSQQLAWEVSTTLPRNGAQAMPCQSDTCSLCSITQSFTWGKCTGALYAFSFQPTALASWHICPLSFSTPKCLLQQIPLHNLQLDTIVVTATRSQEKLENVPARISIIDESLIDQSPIASFPSFIT